MPQVPLDVLDRLAAMEDRIRFLEGRAQIRPALNQILAGDVTVGQGGTFKVNDVDGSPLLYVGQISPNHPDGSAQRGLIVWREDGTQVLTVFTSDTNPQHLSIADVLGNVLIGDDALTGQGLARPYLSSDGWFGAVEQPTATTTSGVFSTVAHLPWIKQHPRVQAFYLVRCSDGSTSGEIRLVDDVGTQIGPTVVVGLGGFTYGSVVGSLNGTHEQQLYLHWQARTTAGSGTIGVKGLTTFGVQS
jgi:hypothetical protein